MDPSSDKSVAPKRILRIDPSKLNSNVQNSLKNALAKLKGPAKLGKPKKAPENAVPESKNGPDLVATPTTTTTTSTNHNQSTTATVTTPLHVDAVQTPPMGNGLPEFKTLMPPKIKDPTRNIIRDRLEKRRLEMIAKFKRNEALPKPSAVVDDKTDTSSHPPPPEHPSTDRSVIKSVDGEISLPADKTLEEDPNHETNENLTIVGSEEGCVYRIQLLSEPLVIPMTPEMESISVPVIVSPKTEQIHILDMGAPPPVIQVADHLQDNCVPEPMDVDYELSPGTQSSIKISVIENVEAKNIDFMNMRVSQTNVSMIGGTKKLNGSHDSNDSEDFVGFETGEVDVSERTVLVNKMINKLDKEKRVILESAKPELTRDMDGPRKTYQRLRDVLTADSDGGGATEVTGEVQFCNRGNDGDLVTVPENSNNNIQESISGTAKADDPHDDLDIVLEKEEPSFVTVPEENPSVVRPVVRTQKLKSIPMRNLKLKPNLPKPRSKGGAKIRPSLMSVAVNLNSPSAAVQDILKDVAKGITKEDIAEPIQEKIEEKVESPPKATEERVSDSENDLVIEPATSAVHGEQESKATVSDSSPEETENEVNADIITTPEVEIEPPVEQHELVSQELSKELILDQNQSIDEPSGENISSSECSKETIVDSKLEKAHSFRTPSTDKIKNLTSAIVSSLENRKSVLSILKNSPSFKKLCEELTTADNFPQTDTDESDEESITISKRLFEKLFSKELAQELFQEKTTEVPMEETVLEPVDNQLPSADNDKSMLANITQDDNPVAIPMLVNNPEPETTSEEPPRTVESPLPVIGDLNQSEEEDIESPPMEALSPIKDNIVEESPGEEYFIEIPVVDSELNDGIIPPPTPSTEDLRDEIVPKPSTDEATEMEVEVAEAEISHETPEEGQRSTEETSDPLVKLSAQKGAKSLSGKQAGKVQLQLSTRKPVTVRKSRDIESEVEQNDPPVVEEQVNLPAIETKKSRPSRSSSSKQSAEWNIVKSPIMSVGKENAETTRGSEDGNKLLMTLKRPSTRRMSVALRKDEEHFEEPPKKRERAIKATVDEVTATPQPAVVKTIDPVNRRTRRKSTIKPQHDEEDIQLEKIITEKPHSEVKGRRLERSKVDEVTATPQPAAVKPVDETTETRRTRRKSKIKPKYDEEDIQLETTENPHSEVKEKRLEGSKVTPATVNEVMATPQPAVANAINSVKRRMQRRSTIKPQNDEDDDQPKETISEKPIKGNSKSNVSPRTSKVPSEQLEVSKVTPATVQAKIHNFFAPTTKSLQSKPRTENTCGNCKEVVPVGGWRKHVAKHYGLAWIDGLENKINLSCATETTRVVQHFMTAHGITQVKCVLCKATRRSAAGLATHMNSCGKTSEELEALKIACQHCDARVLPYSLTTHYRSCSVLAAARRAELAESIQVVEEEEESTGDETLKRSGRGRVLRQKNLNNSHSATELREHYSRRTFSSRVHKKWQAESKQGTELKCFSNKCKFHTKDLREMETHHNSCELAQLNRFACKLCTAETRTQEEMESHLIKDHFSKNTGDSDAEDPFGDHSEDASVGSESSDSEGSSGVDEQDDYTEDEGDYDSNNDNRMGRKRSKCPEDLFVRETVLPKLRSYAEDYKAFKKRNYSMEPLFTRWMPPPGKSIIVVEKDFEGNSEERSNTFVNIQCGLIIESISWVPRSDDNQQQLLALLCKPKDLPYITMRHKEPVDTIIQLWSIDSKTTFSADHLYSIVLPNGPICAMCLCPSGGESEKRMGLMALTSVSGDVNIVAFPHVSPRWQGKALKLPANVVLKGNVDSIGTTLDWDKRKGHEIITGGFMNGMVAFWRLNSNTSKLQLNGNGDVLPFRIFQPFCTPILALAMNNNYFLVGSGARVKIFEMSPHGCTEMTTIMYSLANISSAKWVPNSPYLLVGMQRTSSFMGAYIVMPFTSVTEQVRLFPTTTLVPALSYSPELKMVLGGTERGEIITRAMDQKSAWYHGGQFTKIVSSIRNGVVHSNSKAKEKVDVNSTESIISIEFNPTTKYKQWYAVGYEKGLVRVNKIC